jgi:hypothetical protein
LGVRDKRTAFVVCERVLGRASWRT